mmetsp:Transcript_19864/g.31563  ORF Transcript_19864/g.31563 Transcript_19864/m.31563 type:complete len:238 (+) Transcript_19864:153-866(+)|eukprot:jgi/Bigna1/85936/estExt_fgenesh1_pg.C_70056
MLNLKNLLHPSSGAGAIAWLVALLVLSTSVDFLRKGNYQLKKGKKSYKESKRLRKRWNFLKNAENTSSGSKGTLTPANMDPLTPAKQHRDKTFDRQVVNDDEKHVKDRVARALKRKNPLRDGSKLFPRDVAGGEPHNVDAPKRAKRKRKVDDETARKRMESRRYHETFQREALNVLHALDTKYKEQRKERLEEIRKRAEAKARGSGSTTDSDYTSLGSESVSFELFPEESLNAPTNA